MEFHEYRPFRIGDRVNKGLYGRGTVIGYDRFAGTVRVKWDDGEIVNERAENLALASVRD